MPKRPMPVEEDPTSKVPKMDTTTKKMFSLDISSDSHIKIDRKYVVNAIKNQNIDRHLKLTCKVLKLSQSDWTSEDILVFLNQLKSQKFLNLFIFNIEINSNGLNSKNVKEGDDIKERLLKFGHSRPIILQLTALDEKVTKIYVKEEASCLFVDIEQEEENSEEMKSFSSFLRSFLEGKFKDYSEIVKALQVTANCSLILKFLRTLDLSTEAIQELILKYAACGTKSDFLAALDAPFESDGRVIDIDAQQYLSTVIDGNQSTVFDAEDTDGDVIMRSLTATTSSVLLKAVKNKNTEVIDYLITYWSHLIQQLPFKHQVRISTAAFETGQPHVLCDLLDIADFPFPENFKFDNEKDHKTLGDIILERKEFHETIKEENFGKIDQFITTKPSLKKFFNTENRSALYHASELRKFGVFYYLKSLGFPDEADDFDTVELSAKERKNAMRQAVIQRKHNINMSLATQHKSVFLLATKSSIHNRRISQEQEEKSKEEKYHEKIKKWFEDIYKIAPELLDVAASCKDLKIIFDFESESVENASLLESNSLGCIFPIRKFIFVGAKMSTENREQQIKGVLANELCQFVMKLVYDNQEKPYYKHKELHKNMFDEIVRSIDKWSLIDSKESDDECGGTISSVYKLYNSKDFHPELIARAVQILAEFDDDPEKSSYLQKKYKILFDYWENQVIPEFQIYLQKNNAVIKLNRHFGLLNTIQESQKLKNCEPNVTDKLIDTKMTILSTNVPRLLLVEMANYLREKDGILFDSRNLFVDPLKLVNPDIWENFKQTLSLNSEIMNVFVDCTKGFNVNDLKHNSFKEHNFIFVKRTESQQEETLRILAQKMKIVPKIVEKNYKWNDLTEESQGILFQTKIKFQNHPQINLKDLLDKDKKGTTIIRDFSNIIDDQLLNLLVQKQEISINAKLESEYGKNFELLFKPRKFIRQHNKEADKLSEDELLSEVKNNQYVLISDIAGSGKSWAMKNIAKSLREYYPTNWVTYIDLKQFIDESKTQERELEFETFMVEHILKLYHQFEANIFKQLYKDGKLFILFDGFDEIAPNYAEFVLKLAQNFQSNGGNQLLIATRDYFEVDLQDKLKIDVVYSLDEMTENEGVEYIAKSWVLMDLIKNKNESKSREIFSKCIEMSSEYENYSQKARQIIKAIIPGKSLLSLPQMFKMIADNFKDEANKNNASKFKIYMNFLKVLYKIWSEEKGQIRNEAAMDSQFYRFNFLAIHQFHAVASLFPEHIKELFPDYDGSEWPAEEIIAGGIMNIKNGKICFIHEIFRDLFVADLIIKELRLSTQRKTVLDIFVKILTNRSYSAIQIFLNDAVKSEPALLSNMEHKLLKYADDFCNMDNFEDYLINDVECLTNMIMNILKSGNYKNVKELLTKSAPKVIESIENPDYFYKFEDFLFNTLKSEDTKAILKDEVVLQRLIQSNLSTDVIENSFKKIANKFSEAFAKEILSSKSIEFEGNILSSACTSAYKGSLNISRCVIILQNFYTMPDIIEQLSDCNQRGESVLHVCAQIEDDERLKLVCAELQLIIDPEDFKELLLKQTITNQYNILHYAAFNTRIEFHMTLWELMLRIIDDRNDFKKFLCQVDLDGYNFLHLLISVSNYEIIEFTFNILRQNFNHAQFNEIIKQKDLNEQNLLQIAIKGSKNIQVFQLLWKLFEQILNSNLKFLQLMKEVDRNSNNLVHFAAAYGLSDVFKFITDELEKITSSNAFRQLLNILGEFDQNILQLAAKNNNSIELHELLWKILKKYFEPPQIVKFINHVDKFKENVFMTAAKNNSMEIIQLVWNKIKEVLSQSEWTRYLKSKCINGNTLKNICSRKRNICNWLNRLFQDNGISSDSESSSAVEFDSSSEENMDRVNENAHCNLILAIKNNRPKEVEKVLNDCDDFDINQLSAIDYAWCNYINDNTKKSELNKCERIMMCLLRANSCLPNYNIDFDYERENEDVQSVIDLKDQIQEIIEQYPYSSYFSVRNNEDVLLHALRLQRLIVMNKINPQRQNNLRNDLDKHPPVQILQILLKSFITGANDSKGFNRIQKALSSINRIQDCSNILKIAACIKIEIRFNYERDIDQSQIPQRSIGQPIYIGVKNLLEASNKQKGIGFILNKLAHPVLDLIFMNESLPYPKNDTKLRESFKDIFDNIKQMNDERRKLDGIFKKVFQLSQDSHAALIIAAMQFVIENINNPNYIHRNQKRLNRLYKYLKDIVISECEEVLPVVKLINSSRTVLQNNTAFDCLTKTMQEGVMHKQIRFQGQEMTISDFEEIVEHFHIYLDMEDIKKIILHDEVLDVGKRIGYTHNNHIVERKFTKVGINLNAEHLEEDEQTLDQIIDKIDESKVFILLNSPKSGSTIYFEHIAAVIKNKHADHLVILIKLEDYIEIIRQHNIDFDASQIPDYLAKILQIKKSTERGIFFQLYEVGKIIILFDSFNEISESFIEIFEPVFREFHEKQTNMILIATNQEQSSILRRIFTNTDFYTFVPFTPAEIAFINEM